MNEHKEKQMSSDTACKSQKESQVGAEFNTLEKVQDSLSDQVSQLGDRLVSAMRGPNSIGEGSAEEASLVPVASRIRDCRYGAERSLSKIEDILDRLELP